MNRIRSTCLSPRENSRQQSFFNRDEDDDKEFEASQKDYSNARQELSRVKHDLEDAKSEYSNVISTFNDRESFASSLSEQFGSNSNESAENTKIRHRIALLAIEIEDIEHKIQENKKKCISSKLDQLEKERTMYSTCIVNLRKDDQQIKTAIRQKQVELFDILMSERWREAIETSAEHQIAYRIRQQLQNNELSEFQQTNEPTLQMQLVQQLSNLPDTAKLRELLQNQVDLIKQRNQAQYKRFCAQIRRRVKIASMLDDLQRLDCALRSLGQEGLCISDLRRQYLPEGPLSPLKRPKSSTSTARGRTELSTNSSGRSKSDIKRPYRGKRDILSPLGGTRRRNV